MGSVGPGCVGGSQGTWPLSPPPWAARSQGSRHLQEKELTGPAGPVASLGAGVAHGSPSVPGCPQWPPRLWSPVQALLEPLHHPLPQPLANLISVPSLPRLQKELLFLAFPISWASGLAIVST